MTAEHTAVVNGEPAISTEAMALLVGVTPDAIRDEMLRQHVGPGGPLILPAAWVESGRAITARLRDEYGITDMASAIGILRAERDRAARQATP